MMGTARLSVRLLRRHLSLYAGCMVTIGASAVIASTEAMLVETFSRPGSVTVSGLSADEVALQMAAVRGLFTIFASLVIVIGGFLVWSAVKQVVSFRQRELALMRLAGASRGQLARAVSLECLVLAFLVALPCAVLGELLAPALFSGLQRIGFLGASVTAQFGPSVIVAIGVPAVLAVTSAIAGGLAALAATRGDLLSAVNPIPRSLSRVQIVVRVLIAAAGAVGIATLDPIGLGANIILVLPLLVVVPLVAIAPLFVPAGAWIIGQVIGVAAPGPGVLAAERAGKDRVRFARLATPAIIAVGVLGGFLVANAPDEQATSADYERRLAASAVAFTTGTANADETAAALRKAGAKNVARKAQTHQQTTTNTPEVVHFADPDAFATLLSQHVTAGSLAKVKGRNIASSGGAELGDKVTIHDASGKAITLTVVALINDDLWEGIWINWTELPTIVENPAALSTTVFADSITQPQAAAAVAKAGVAATVTDRAGFIQAMREARAANTYRSNIGIFGTIYLMCLISLFQSAVSGAVARRREFRVLGSLGVGRGGILQTVSTESVIIQAVAGALLTVVLVAIASRFAFLNGTSAVDALAAVTPQTGIAFASVAIAALLAQLMGTEIALSRRTDQGALQTVGQ